MLMLFLLLKEIGLSAINGINHCWHSLVVIIIYVLLNRIFTQRLLNTLLHRFERKIRICRLQYGGGRVHLLSNHVRIVNKLELWSFILEGDFCCHCAIIDRSEIIIILFFLIVLSLSLVRWIQKFNIMLIYYLALELLNKTVCINNVDKVKEFSLYILLLVDKSLLLTC